MDNETRVQVHGGQVACSQRPGKGDQEGASRESFRGDTPSTVKISRYMTGYLPSLGLSLLIGKIRVKIKETRSSSLPGTFLILVSILPVYLVHSQKGPGLDNK